MKNSLILFNLCILFSLYSIDLHAQISSEKKYNLINVAYPEMILDQSYGDNLNPLDLVNFGTAEKLYFTHIKDNDYYVRSNRAGYLKAEGYKESRPEIRPIFKSGVNDPEGDEFVFTFYPTGVENEFYIISKLNKKYFDVIQSPVGYGEVVALRDKTGANSQKWKIKEIKRKELDTQRAYQIDKGITGKIQSSRVGEHIAISENKKLITVSSSRSDSRSFGEIFTYKITDDGHLEQLGKETTLYGRSSSINRSGEYVLICDDDISFDRKRFAGLCYVVRYNQDLDTWVRISDPLVGEKEGDLFGIYHWISPDAKTIKIVATQKLSLTNPVGGSTTVYSDGEGYTKTYELENGRYREVKKEIGYDPIFFDNRLPTSLEFSQIIDRYGDRSINKIAQSIISTDGNTLVVGDYYFDYYEGRAIVFDYSHYQKEIPNEKFFNIFHSKTNTKLSRTNQIVRVHDRRGEKWRLEKIPYTKYFRIVSANDGLSIGDQNGQVLLINEHNQLLTDKESLQWELIAETVHGKTFFYVKNRSTGKYLCLESETNWIAKLTENPNEYSKWNIQADYSVDCEPLKIKSKSIKNLCPTSDDIVKGNRNFDSNVAARVTVAPLPTSLGDKNKLIVRIGLKLEGENGTVVEKYWDEELISLRNKVIHTNGLPSVAIAKKTLPESGGEFLDCHPGETHRIFFEENSLVDYVDIIADTGNDDIDSNGDCNCDARIVEVKFKSFEICTENKEVEKQRNENQPTPTIM